MSTNNTAVVEAPAVVNDASATETAEKSSLASPFPSFEAPVTDAPVVKPTVTTPAVAPRTVASAVTAPAPAASATARDLTGIPEEYHAELKQMSLAAFNKIKPLLVDVASGKLVNADSINEKLEVAQLEQHPRGFVISKEFEDLTTQHASELSNKEMLIQALLQVKANKPFTLEVVRDGKVVKEKFQASPKNELILQDLYQQASTKAAKLELDLEEMEKNHATKHSVRAKDFEAFESKLFSQYDSQPAFKEAIALVEKDQNIPKGMRNSPYFGFIKKQIALNLIAMEAIHRNQLKVNAAETDAGATPSSVSSGGVIAGDKNLNAIKRNRAFFGLPDADE